MTQTLSAPDVGAAFPEFVSKKICFFLEKPHSASCLSLQRSLRHSDPFFLYLVCLLASLLSPLSLSFLVLTLHKKSRTPQPAATDLSRCYSPTVCSFDLHLLQIHRYVRVHACVCVLVTCYHKFALMLAGRNSTHDPVRLHARRLT